jgi:heme oxygenase
MRLPPGIGSSAQALSTTTSTFRELKLMSHKNDPYTELKQQISDDLRAQHPEWIDPTGDCPTCESYLSRLSQMLSRLADHIRPRRTKANTKSARV